MTTAVFADEASNVRFAPAISTPAAPTTADAPLVATPQDAVLFLSPSDTRHIWLVRLLPKAAIYKAAGHADDEQTLSARTNLKAALKLLNGDVFRIDPRTGRFNRFDELTGRFAPLPRAAADEPDDGHGEIHTEIAEGSGIDGVVDVVKNKQGEITKMVVVGAAKITTVLGAADGLQTARNEARLRAVGKFRQFLEEKVSVTETTETERTIKLVGDGNDLSESGKRISKNTEKYKTFSEGMVRGMQMLGYKTVKLNDKEKMYVVVLGWSKDLAAKTRALANELDKPRTPGTQPAAVSAADAEERRKLEDKSGVLPAAKGFFDEN